MRVLCAPAIPVRTLTGDSRECELSRRERLELLELLELLVVLPAAAPPPAAGVCVPAAPLSAAPPRTPWAPPPVPGVPLALLLLPEGG